MKLPDPNILVSWVSDEVVNAVYDEVKWLIDDANPDYLTGYEPY